MSIGSFVKNKKWVRTTGILLLILFVFFGIARACFFSRTTRQKSYYLIARDINWNDFHFSGKEPNIQAFAEELILEASKEVHLKVQFGPASPLNLLDALKAGRYDAVFTFMTPNSYNEEIYYFSDPLYVVGSVLVVREDSEVKNLEEMQGKIVGISSESSSIYDVEHYPSIIIVTYENINTALNDLANNKIDGVIMDAWSAQVNTHAFFANKLKIATVPFTRQGLRLVTLIEDNLEDFMKSLDDGLERLKASGQYQKLIHKWGLYEMQ